MTRDQRKLLAGFRITPEQDAALDKASRKLRKTRARIVRDAIDRYLTSVPDVDFTGKQLTVDDPGYLTSH